jgi:hypothetical protein
MTKYSNLENMGEVFAEELFADGQFADIEDNEIFYRKLVNKLAESYNFGLQESVNEVQEAIDSIKSLKVKRNKTIEGRI